MPRIEILDAAKSLNNVLIMMGGMAVMVVSVLMAAAIGNYFQRRREHKRDMERNRDLFY